MRQLHLLILALLLAAPVSGQFVTNRITGSGGGGGGGTAAPDWTSAMVWCQDFDGDLTDDCGTDDFTAGATTAYDATNKMQGTHALLLADATTDPATCANGTCTTLAALAGDFSAACWVRPTSSVRGYILAFGGVAAAEGGFAFRQDTTGLQWNFWVGDGTDSVTDNSVGDWALDTWQHITLVHSATDDDVRYYLDALEDAGSPFTQQDMAATTRNPLAIGGVGGEVLAGQIDECVVDDIEWGPETICRLRACGRTGALCEISGTSWVDTGRHASASSPCNLPTDASQAAPGTN